MLHENYKILEHIKDGKAMAGKFNSKLLKFKKPNIVIVFSNNEPNMSHLSMDRWRIFKISKDLEHLEERGVKQDKSKCKTDLYVDEDSMEEVTFSNNENCVIVKL